MNKHDIEELQAFLQGEYIEESTSRSLKEVKQHQKDVSSNKDAGDITRVRKVLKSKLENDNTNNTYGRYDGKRDVYDKTPAIRDKIRIHLFMKKSECKNSDELYAFNYADKVLSGLNKTEVKNKMCRLVGFNPKVYGMDLYKHQPGEYFSVNFIENATKSRQLSPTEINKYRYFHFSKTGNLHNVGLSSSRSTIHGGGSIIYPSKCIFFYAVEKTADLDNVLARMINGDPRGVRSAFFYGDYVYEYIPKKSDKIYIDSTDDSNLLQLQQKTRNHGFFKVFLNLAGEGRSSVPVKEFNFNISYNKQNIMNQEETKLRSYTARLEDIYDWNPKQADKVVDIFSKYIHDHEANPNSPKPRKELDTSLKSLADFYRSAVDKFIDEEKIPQEERRLFKKNAYGHFHKILKTKLDKRFEYGSNDYKTLTKYFHESYIDENVDDDYITEASSKSLKEVKQHQQTQIKNNEFVDIKKMRAYLKKHLFSNNMNMDEEWKQWLMGDMYNRGPDKFVLNIEKPDESNVEEFRLYKTLYDTIINSANGSIVKKKIFKYLGLKGNDYEIWGHRQTPQQIVTAYLHRNNSGITGPIEIAFKKVTKNEGRKAGIYNNIYLIHLSPKDNLPNLRPTQTNTVNNRTYSEPCVFFFCVKASNINDAIKKIAKSNSNDTVGKKGTFAYWYKPKQSTTIFLDRFHTNEKEVESRDLVKDITPVFVKTRSPLLAKNVSDILQNELNNVKSESYIDETIERFDAFMEEFNLTHNEYIQEIKPTIEPEKPLTDKEKRLKEIRDRMVWHTRELSYSEYSKLRDEFSRLTGYPRDSVLNPGAQQLIGNVHNWNLTKFQGAKSPKKINVLPGTHFFHNSPNPNLVVSLKHFYSDDRMTSMFGVEYPEILYPYPRLYFYKEHVGGNETGNAGEKVKSYDKNGMPIFDEKLKNGRSHCYMYISKPGDEFFYDPEMPDSDIAFLKLTKPIKLIKIY